MDRRIAGVCLKAPPVARMPHFYPEYGYAKGKDHFLGPKVKRFRASFDQDVENMGKSSEKVRPNEMDSQVKMLTLSHVLGKQVDLLGKQTRLGMKMAALKALVGDETSESEASGHVWPGDDDDTDDDEREGRLCWKSLGWKNLFSMVQWTGLR